MPDLNIPVYPRPYRLHNQIQPYEWGARGQDALIPRLLGFEPEPGRPYAELWIGAHPKAPSQVIAGEARLPLDRWIEQHPQEILGAPAVRRFGPRMPFLFKVLSAAAALSIQAHPNQAQAEALHARSPEHYPDGNHKPEIAVAYDSLDALVGVKPIAGLRATLNRIPELSAFIGPEVRRFEEASGSLQEAAHVLFAALLHRSVTHPQELEENIDRLARRLEQASGRLEEDEALFSELRQQYRGPDVGMFALFLLNLVHLQKGQAVYTSAGMPHAYLKGNIIECMANSDNVVRVGLTPKFKDAETMIRILDANPRPAQIMDAGPGAGFVRYPVPSDEFGLTRLGLPAGAVQRWENAGRLSIFLVTGGQVSLSWDEEGHPGEMECQAGGSVLLPAILDRVDFDAKEPAELFLAGIPVPG